LGRISADAHGQVGRADAATGPLGEEALDATVLERVEGERADAATDLRDAPAERERLVELLQLAVDRDADCLEGALGRVAAGKAGGRGDRGGDRLVELEGRRELLAAAAADDLARD